MDNTGTPTGKEMLVLYDEKGNFKGYSTTAANQSTAPSSSQNSPAQTPTQTPAAGTP